MVNREQLEKDIDDLLDNITDDELVSWYNSKAQIDVESYLGQGSLLDIAPLPRIEFVPRGAAEIIVDKTNSDISNNEFGIAA